MSVDRPSASAGSRGGEDSDAGRIAHAFSFRNIGAVYVWLAIVVIFSIWIPGTFDTASTFKQILNANAVTALLALSLLVPLATRVFDLSIAYIATLAGVTVTHFVVAGVPLAGAIAIALAVSFGVGVLNAVVVVLLQIDSFIATLATGSLIAAFITIFTKNIAITSAVLNGPFARVGEQSIGGITLPVFYMLATAGVLWFVLEQTATGRRMYATGFNEEAARLSGVRVNRLRFISLLVSATIAGFAGIVLASVIDSGDPSSGTPYLLPAFAAAFLGATQLRGGRFNARGTLIAVLLLGTGTTGLGLASAPNWTEDMFTGLVLIAALAVTGGMRARAGGGARRPRWRAVLRKRQAAEPTGKELSTAEKEVERVE